MKNFLIVVIAIIYSSLFVSGCSNNPSLSSEDTASENLKKSNQFLSENKSDSDIKVTSSGLQYKVLKEGSGKKANRYSDVHVYYEGRRLGDITPFDFSNVDEPPVKVPLPAVIEGWREGISLMREGSSYLFYIPPHLAYGEKGPKAGKTKIGPNVLLIYKIDLEKVE